LSGLDDEEAHPQAAGAAIPLGVGPTGRPSPEFKAWSLERLRAERVPNACQRATGEAF